MTEGPLLLQVAPKALRTARLRAIVRLGARLGAGGRREGQAGIAHEAPFLAQGPLRIGQAVAAPPLAPRPADGVTRHLGCVEEEGANEAVTDLGAVGLEATAYLPAGVVVAVRVRPTPCRGRNAGANLAAEP